MMPMDAFQIPPEIFLPLAMLLAPVAVGALRLQISNRPLSIVAKVGSIRTENYDIMATGYNTFRNGFKGLLDDYHNDLESMKGMRTELANRIEIYEKMKRFRTKGKGNSRDGRRNFPRAKEICYNRRCRIHWHRAIRKLRLHRMMEGPAVT
jgi:hypothetical protein